MKIGKATKQIESYLIKYPPLRDDDNRLICSIWKWEIENILKLNYSSLSADELLKMYASHKLTSSESIRRTRCKLQELKPKLRGLKYEERQKATQKVKKEMRDWITEDVNQLKITDVKCSCTNPYEYQGICADCGLNI